MSLAGRKTYVVGAVSIALGVALQAGVTFPGIVADPAELILGGLGLLGLRHGMKTGA